MIGNHLPNSIMHLMRQIIPLNCNIQLTNTSAGLHLDPYASTILLLIIQEALANCAMHSRATMVTCNIESSETEVAVRIIDNGIGLASEFEKKEGIANMEINAAKLVGKITIYNRCDIDDVHPDGTEVVISIAKEIPKPEVSFHTL